MSMQPLAEVFGFPIANQSAEAVRHRKRFLCPYNNKVPNCTKDKASNPLGVCSVHKGDTVAVTCPIRFRQDWLIADHAAEFFFPPQAKWTSLVEVTLNDKNGRSAGNIDVVLVSYDDKGTITDFGSCEVQAVYISGNVREPFEYYMKNPAARGNFDWTKKAKYPRPDYLSSSRKRLAPQMLFKGGIFHKWSKKQAVVIDKGFFGTLPELAEVPQNEAEIAWLVYDLMHEKQSNSYQLAKIKTVYTKFESALATITASEPGEIELFVESLQAKLDEQLEGIPPDAPTLADEVLS